MNKIKRIEIRDKQKASSKALIELPELLGKIENHNAYEWAILFFDAFYYSENARSIANYINKNIREKKIIPITWEKLKILSTGIGQFIDLVVIGCKDPKNLKPYPDENERIKTCDIVIIMFDGCWWEISCKDEKLMKFFLDAFKEVEIVNW